MDFSLTKEQEFVQKMVRSFAQAEIAPIAGDLDKEHRYPREIVDKMGKLGLMGIPFPKEYEGAGGDSIAYAIAVEELSKAYAATGTMCAAQNSLCNWPIYHFGTEEQKEKYLPDLCSGRKVGGFALTEPNAGSDSALQQTRAEDKGDHWLVNGSKVFITNGSVGDVFVVFAMTDKSKKTRGISAFIVENTFEGFSTGKIEDKMGIRASNTAELVFRNMVVPKENIIGRPGEGFKIAMTTLDGGRIGVAAQAVGIAQGALDVTLDYMKARKQFGRRLADMDPLRFVVAELATEIEAARLLVYCAADLKDRGRPFGHISAMAKYYSSEVAMKTTTKCVQLHGGYGYTADYPVERMMRDAKITEIYEGTTEVQKMVVAGAVIGK
ncbi:MAG: acyl-CoA dehydrogenase [Clostridiales Family XIII bacterium]|jgi:butyryl-CoA dehydrogenase|nr:acyl-CoA dehydrogenase [Clostridiales Family XIII bacterium]